MHHKSLNVDKINKKRYSSRRNEVKHLTNQFMKKIISENILDKEQLEIVNELPLKRMETTQQIRAFLMSLAFDICGGKNHKKLAPAYACIELSVASMYYENRIFDHKGGKRDLATIKKNIMSGYLCRDLAEKSLSYLEHDFSANKVKMCINLLNEIDLIFQIGELQDVFQNTYSKRKNFNFEDQVMFALERTYRINASMVEKAMGIAALLATNSKRKINLMRQFGKYYALAGQLLNDVIDFVPSIYGHTTSEKIEEDTYRDFLNEKMTLPLIYSTNFGNVKEKALIEKLLKKGFEANEKNELIPLTDIMIKNGSFAFGKKVADYYFKKAKALLRNNFGKEDRALLSMSLQVFWNNKYYRSLSSRDDAWRRKYLKADLAKLKNIFDSI